MPIDTSFKTSVGMIEPVDAGELSIAGRSYSSVRGFDQFEDGLKVGNVAFAVATDDKAMNMVAATTAPLFLGVVIRKLGSASVDAYYNDLANVKGGCGLYDPIADICQEGKVTVNAKAGDVYNHGESVFVQADGTVGKAGGVEWTGVSFVRTVKDGVAMINIPTRIS